MAGRIQIHVDVVGTGSDGTEPSVVISVEQRGQFSNDVHIRKRYLFNCGEGTQRICGENGIKLSSLHTCFVTRHAIQTVSGVPGLIFALGVCGAAELQLYGPQGMRSFLQAIQSFVRRKYPVLKGTEITNQSLASMSETNDYKQWKDEHKPLEDQYAQIFAIRLDANATKHENQECIMCLDDQNRSTSWIPRAEKPKQVVQVDESSSSSSTSSEGEEDEESNGNKMTSGWLKAFYQVHQPDKVSHVDRILSQFAGREDTLRQMLMTKYGPDALTNINNKKRSIQPPAHGSDKRPRVETDATPQDHKEEIQVIETIHLSDDPDNEIRDPQPPKASICYVLRFRDAPQSIVWILDCPSVAQIENLKRLGHCAEHAPALIVHFTPRAVRQSTAYREWMKTKDATHLVFDGDQLQQASTADGLLGFVFLASARQHALHHTSNVPAWSNLRQLFQQQTLDYRRRLLLSASPKTHLAQAKLRCQLTVPLQMDYSHTGWQFTSDSGENEATVPPPMIQNPNASHRLVILGTGSAAPSKLRASSGIYLHDGLLLDCGEGTFGQLCRQFGLEEVRDRLKTLRCIWISHHHADHQCGLLRLLSEYQQLHQHEATSAQLVVIAPQSVLSYVASWKILFSNSKISIPLVTCAAFNHVQHPVRRQLLQHLEASVKSMTSVAVAHCFDAYGIVIEFTDGKKLVYSGDTMPCDRLVVHGLHATVLIHEATFDDTMQDDARKKKHSTISQALAIATCMKAQQVILTHFSQRYPTLPPSTVDHIQCAVDGAMYWF